MSSELIAPRIAASGLMELFTQLNETEQLFAFEMNLKLLRGEKLIGDEAEQLVQLYLLRVTSHNKEEIQS